MFGIEREQDTQLLSRIDTNGEIGADQLRVPLSSPVLPLAFPLTVVVSPPGEPVLSPLPLYCRRSGHIACFVHECQRSLHLRRHDPKALSLHRLFGR